MALEILINISQKSVAKADKTFIKLKIFSGRL